MSRKPTVTSLTFIGPWQHGQSAEADCESCDWSTGPGKPRVVQYEARRHAVETDHVATQYLTLNRVIARKEPPR